MREFKITITSEDLKNPAKLACVEAIVGTCFTNGCITSILKGVDVENECFIGDNLYAPVGLLSDDDYQAEDELTLLYSQIKLDPRKLIGEDVDVIIFCKEPSELIEGEFIKCGYEEKLNHLHFCRGKDVIGIDLSKDWLKQNFKCEEV